MSLNNLTNVDEAISMGLLAEEYDEMPKSIRKKWSEAKYGRERYLANEFIKHLESKQLSEMKLRRAIRNIIKEVVNGKKK